MQRGALHDVVSPSQITVNSLNIRKHNVVLNLAVYETSCGCFVPRSSVVMSAWFVHLCQRRWLKIAPERVLADHTRVHTGAARVHLRSELFFREFDHFFSFFF